jgi:hypothetical protein
LAAVCIAGASSFGCASQPHENEVEALGGRMRATYSPETARLQQLTYDLDNDGTVDVRAYLEGERLVRAEADENGDGRVDRWEYYVADGQPVRAAAAAAAPEALPWSSAVVDRIEMSTRRDGNISRREFYEKGVRVRAEEDTNGDARVDKWETYANGTLSTIGFDLSGKGVPDRRLVYGPDGAPTRLEK